MFSVHIQVDKVRFHLPLFLDDGRITINQEGCNIIVQTDFGLKLLYDTQYYVEVDVPSSYKDSLCGLCGNYNGDSQDDFLLPNGQRTADVDVFGRAWVVNLPEVMCGGCGSQCPTCSVNKQALYGQLEFCGIINTTSGPFAACHAVVPPENYVSNCIFDLCTVDGNRTTLCNSVHAYAIACQSAGVQINGWRNISLCRKCKKHGGGGGLIISKFILYCKRCAIHQMRCYINGSSSVTQTHFLHLSSPCFQICKDAVKQLPSLNLPFLTANPYNVLYYYLQSGFLFQISNFTVLIYICSNICGILRFMAVNGCKNWNVKN